MKYLLLALLFAAPTNSFAASKAAFSIFGTANKFAEVTCQGVTNHPGSYTFRLPVTEDRGDSFEAYVNMIDPWALIVTASSNPNGRTLYLAFARADMSSTFASTKGLDLALRIGSGLDVYCELNDGAQITRD